jgi:hypothetical protein
MITQMLHSKVQLARDKTCEMIYYQQKSILILMILLTEATKINITGTKHF